MNYILMMYVTLFSTILAGIFNMIYCKSSILSKMQIPIDRGRNFIDGKRILGNNKTWKGIIGYIFFNTMFAVVWGFLCSIFNLNKFNFFYINYNNTILYNILIGFLLGIAYALFELPNSFIKRRIGIEPGKAINGFKKYFFIFLDQADSIFGCCLVICIFYRMGIKLYLLYVLVGAITHIALNILLYLMKLRKNMF